MRGPAGDLRAASPVLRVPRRGVRRAAAAPAAERGIRSKEGWDKLPAGVDEPSRLTIGTLRLTLALALVLPAAYLIAVWAMAGKPS
jgi:hypothetical protein